MQSLTATSRSFGLDIATRSPVRRLIAVTTYFMPSSVLLASVQRTLGSIVLAFLITDPLHSKCHSPWSAFRYYRQPAGRGITFFSPFNQPIYTIFKTRIHAEFQPIWQNHIPGYPALFFLLPHTLKFKVINRITHIAVISNNVMGVMSDT